MERERGEKRDIYENENKIKMKEISKQKIYSGEIKGRENKMREK